jgi:hypothetical protein
LDVIACTHFGSISARVITEVLPRSQTAQLVLNDWYISETLKIDPIIQGPVPLLNHIFLECLQGVDLTSQFLGGSCRNLRSLVFQCLKKLDNPPAIPASEVLEIPVDWIKKPVDASRLLDFLERTLTLHEVSLVRKDALSEAPCSVDVENLLGQLAKHLHNLQALHLRNYIENTFALLRILPEPKTHLSVAIHWNSWTDDHLPLGHHHMDEKLHSLGRSWINAAGEDRLPGGARGRTTGNPCIQIAPIEHFSSKRLILGHLFQFLGSPDLAACHRAALR